MMDDEDAFEAFLAIRWPHGIRCPYCGQARITLIVTRILFRCSECRRDFSITTGTPFASHKMPLRLCLRAFDLWPTRPVVLQRELGITYRAAWDLARRLKRFPLEMDP